MTRPDGCGTARLPRILALPPYAFESDTKIKVG